MGARRLIIGVVAIAAALATPAGALACSCAQRPAKEAVRDADAAIVARLVRVIRRDDYSADYRYRVQRVRKGGRGLARGRTVSVRGGMSSAACGLPTGVDRRYGLLLFWSEGRWTSNLCNVLEPRRLLHCNS